eukprot:11894524-Alexandrium_andersonii.AAC.1
MILDRSSTRAAGQKLLTKSSAGRSNLTLRASQSSATSRWSARAWRGSRKRRNCTKGPWRPAWRT